MKKGAYITLEGGEGSGKSTQARLLIDYILSKGFPCEGGREPGGIKEAEKIRDILLDPDNDLCTETELLLFEASRTEFFRQKVIPKLNKGITIVADRSGYSSLAYQGYGGGLDLGLIKKLNEVSTFGIKADLVFIININPTEGLKKEQNPDRFKAKKIEYHQRVNQGYLKIARENPSFYVINYDKGNIEKQQEKIRKIVSETLRF